MPDNMKKVSPGEPLSIPAETFNTFIDAGRDFKARQRNATRGRAQSTHNAETILVRNDSGSDRDRFDVLGIDGPIFTPTDNANTFKNQVAVKGITPAVDNHAGKFVILAEPVKNGSITRGFISGVCAAYIDIDDEDHKTADVKDGDATSLVSGDDGAVSILWAESGTGNKWAVVRFSGVGGTGIKRAKAQEGSQADGEISVKLLDSSGDVIGDAFDVYAFPDKSATDMTDYLPDIDTDDVLLVCKANDGNWYLVWPTLKEVGVATSTVSLTAGTLFGRVTNVYGKW